MVSSWNFQRSKVKVTEVKTQISRFGTITPIWLNIWWWNDAQSSVLFRGSALLIFQGHLSNFKVTRLKNRWFRPKLGISRLYLQFEFTDGYEMMLKSWSSIEEVPYCFSRLSVKFQGHKGQTSLILSGIERFRTVTPVWIRPWLWNDLQSLK